MTRLTFGRVYGDIMEWSLTQLGNRYVVVFLDYLTMWVEAYPLPDQINLTIARVLVAHVICRHGVPHELLFDRGANLYSELIINVFQLSEMTKVNITAHHL